MTVQLVSRHPVEKPTPTGVRWMVRLQLIEQPRFGDRPRFAWYVTPFTTLRRPLVDVRVFAPPATVMGPFRSLQAALKQARWTCAHHNGEGIQ